MSNNISEHVSMTSIVLTVISSVISFFIGKLYDNLYNRFVSPKINIDGFIGYDEVSNSHYIQIMNCSRGEAYNAYDLRFSINYCKRIDNVFKPYHVGEIKDGRLKAEDTRKYNITPPSEIKFDFASPDYKLEVILTYRNKNRKYVTIERDCVTNNDPVITLYKT